MTTTKISKKDVREQIKINQNIRKFDAYEDAITHYREMLKNLNQYFKSINKIEYLDAGYGLIIQRAINTIHKRFPQYKIRVFKDLVPWSNNRRFYYTEYVKNRDKIDFLKVHRRNKIQKNPVENKTSKILSDEGYYKNILRSINEFEKNTGKTITKIGKTEKGYEFICSMEIKNE